MTLVPGRDYAGGPSRTTTHTASQCGDLCCVPGHLTFPLEPALHLTPYPGKGTGSADSSLTCTELTSGRVLYLSTEGSMEVWVAGKDLKE